ncbi:MAG: alpha-ketoglutarate-dependent taurine dioxygenase [Parasphingorhabdus sp.]|jgi:alpha-ketoglutarate-dependent taurine dioxygenase
MKSSSDNTALDLAEHVIVKPMTVHIGAEISGVDLTAPLTEEEIYSIRQALLRWKVVFFRQQELTHSQHIAFARQFGDITPAHAVFGGDSEYPEIYPVTRGRTAFAARPAALRPWTDWHTDVTAAINPPFASILRGVIVPPFGGDTHWCNTQLAFSELSSTMQKFVSTLRCIHGFKTASDRDKADDYNQSVQRNPLSAEHPLVTVHPETGVPSLYATQEFTQEVVGLTARESELLLEYLWEHCIQSRYCVRFKWEPGSIAFWDNRSTQHQAIRDVYDTDFEREFYRVTLNGEIPVGVDGQPSRHISGRPIVPH